MRVIAGQLGGRKLVAPAGQTTRPTSDRVREALFSALGDVTGASVLDLFAGTGALGIEAVSRGAARVTFVENARHAITALKQNVHDLGLDDRAKLFAMTVERAGVAGSGPFDLVFVDPPYAVLETVPAAIARLMKAGCLSPGARVVVEHASRDAAPALEGLTPRPSRVYGDTSVTVYDLPAADS